MQAANTVWSTKMHVQHILFGKNGFNFKSNVAILWFANDGIAGDLLKELQGTCSSRFLAKVDILIGYSTPTCK